MPLLTELHIDQLSVEDRIQLVQEIWDSVAESQSAVPLTEAQQRELERRLVDHELHPDDVVPWEQVKSAALARLSR